MADARVNIIFGSNAKEFIPTDLGSMRTAYEQLGRTAQSMQGGITTQAASESKKRTAIATGEAQAYKQTVKSVEQYRQEWAGKSTEKLIAYEKQLSDQRTNAVNQWKADIIAGNTAAIAADKKQIEAASSELRSLRQVSIERPGVLHGGMGAIIGQLGIGRFNMGPLGGVTRMLSGMGPAGIAAGAGIGATALALKKTIGVGADFDSQMTQVFAVYGHLTEDTKQRMIKAALAVSKATNTSAADVGKGFYYLASSGMNAKQAIASLPAVARFAKAGMFDLATATNLAAGAENALGLASTNAAVNQRNLIRVTDVLTTANNEANGTIELYSQALTNEAGAALKTAGKSIEEGTAALMVFANENLEGAAAGTALTIVLKDLEKVGLKNEAAWKKQGIAVYDTNGKMLNLADIMGELEKKTANLSGKQKTALLESLGFQERSVQFIQELIGSSKEMRDFQTKLEHSAGATAATAKKQMQSFDEHLKHLKVTIEDELIPAFYKIEPALLGTVKDLGGFVKIIGNNLPLIGEAAGAIGGLTLAYKAFTIASEDSPLGLTMMATSLAIAGVTAAMIALKPNYHALDDEIDKSNATLQKFNDKLADASAADTHADNVKKLVQHYKDLASITKRTKKEEADLKETTKELSAASGIQASVTAKYGSKIDMLLPGIDKWIDKETTLGKQLRANAQYMLGQEAQKVIKKWRENNDQITKLQKDNPILDPTAYIQPNGPMGLTRALSKNIDDDNKEIKLRTQESMRAQSQLVSLSGTFIQSLDAKTRKSLDKTSQALSTQFGINLATARQYAEQFREASTPPTTTPESNVTKPHSAASGKGSKAASSFAKTAYQKAVDDEKVALGKKLQLITANATAELKAGKDVATVEAELNSGKATAELENQKLLLGIAEKYGQKRGLFTERIGDLELADEEKVAKKKEAIEKAAERADEKAWQKHLDFLVKGFAVTNKLREQHAKAAERIQIKLENQSDASIADKAKRETAQEDTRYRREKMQILDQADGTREMAKQIDEQLELLEQDHQTKLADIADIAARKSAKSIGIVSKAIEQLSRNFDKNKSSAANWGEVVGAVLAALIEKMPDGTTNGVTKGVGTANAPLNALGALLKFDPKGVETAKAGVNPLRSMPGAGKIYGPGGPTDDRIPILASPGEVILPANLAAQIEASITGAQRFAHGGVVGDSHMSLAELLAGAKPHVTMPAPVSETTHVDLAAARKRSNEAKKKYQETRAETQQLDVENTRAAMLLIKRTMAASKKAYSHPVRTGLLAGGEIIGTALIGSLGAGVVGHTAADVAGEGIETGAELLTHYGIERSASYLTDNLNETNSGAGAIRSSNSTNGFRASRQTSGRDGIQPIRSASRSGASGSTQDLASLRGFDVGGYTGNPFAYNANGADVMPIGSAGASTPGSPGFFDGTDIANLLQGKDPIKMGLTSKATKGALLTVLPDIIGAITHKDPPVQYNWDGSKKKPPHHDEALGLLGKIAPIAANLLVPGSGVILGPVLDSLGVNASGTKKSLFDTSGMLGMAGGALKFLTGLDGGGFTGGTSAGKKRAAGIVHENEFVFSSDAVDRIGVGNLDRLHHAARGYETGGYVSNYYPAHPMHKQMAPWGSAESFGVHAEKIVKAIQSQKLSITTGDVQVSNNIGTQQMGLISG